MRILFLDFDGVLITKPLSQEPTAECIRQLNRITDSTGAQIVVSSSWRHGMTMDGLRQLLKSWGVRGVVIAQTPSVHQANSTRGDEIAAWIKSKGGDIGDFVIVDDDDEMFPFHSQHVLTTFEDGLTKERADKALALFGFPVELNAEARTTI